MKVISIKQPWASLITLGEKRFETRSWATKYRGELAIHASKKVDRKAYMNETIYKTLQKHGILFIDDLPTGSILATSVLEGCYPINHSNSISELASSINKEGEIELHISDEEFIFGDYTEGRFAWKLTHVQELPNPVPAKGQLGLWTFLEDETEVIANAE